MSALVSSSSHGFSFPQPWRLILLFPLCRWDLIDCVTQCHEYVLSASCVLGTTESWLRKKTALLPASPRRPHVRACGLETASPGRGWWCHARWLRVLSGEILPTCAGCVVTPRWWGSALICLLLPRGLGLGLACSKGGLRSWTRETGRAECESCPHGCPGERP